MNTSVKDNNMAIHEILDTEIKDVYLYMNV